MDVTINNIFDDFKMVFKRNPGYIPLEELKHFLKLFDDLISFIEQLQQNTWQPPVGQRFIDTYKSMVSFEPHVSYYDGVDSFLTLIDDCSYFLIEYVSQLQRDGTQRSALYLINEKLDYILIRSKNRRYR